MRDNLLHKLWSFSFAQPPFFFPRPFWPVDVLSPEEEAELEAGTDNEFKADLWLLLESAW